MAFVDHPVRRENFKPDLSEKGFQFFKYPTQGPEVYTTTLHFHEAIECVYLERGSLELHIDGREHHAKAGDLILFRSMSVHSMYTGSEERNDYYVLKIEPRVLFNVSPKTLSGAFALRFITFDPDSKPIFTREELQGTDIEIGISRLISELSSPGEISDLSMIISGLLVLEGIYKISSSAAPRAALTPTASAVFEAIIYVNSNLGEDITEARIAKKVGVGYSHFSREFKRAAGTTFKKYLMLVRINHAEALLINTDLSVNEISMRCGYDNISYFISIYKRIKGTTPLKAREKSRLNQKENG